MPGYPTPKLLYFTASYPFGFGEQWKANEVAELVHTFSDITVVPFTYGGNSTDPKPLPPGVKLEGPLVKDSSVPLRWFSFLLIVAHACRFRFLREFFRKKVYRRRSHFMSWMSASLNAIRLLDSPIIKDRIINCDEGAVLYFYWGRGACEFLPFVDTSKFDKIVVRMHRYDLFEYANDGYIPYREDLLNSITLTAPSSEAGETHLKALYPKAKAEIAVLRCGTVNDGGMSPEPEDKVLRVVSCSYLFPVKRVNLMIESLAYVDFPIMWRHVGDGALMDQLKDLVREKGLEEKFIFEGALDTRDVLNFLTANGFDLFVNTSASEGVPFSIMEALSVGLPIMATDVGGSGEIVHEGVGVLLPAAPTPQDLARALTAFHGLPRAQRRAMRKQAYEDYRGKWDARTLSRQLATLLAS
jgi:colanic acid/amylovoran biosynthesis glycosyltransferase